jgi:HEPN domain-containing protein
MAHLALEKLLKAKVCRHTNDLAPRSHDLIRLAELAGLNAAPDQMDALADMNQFNLRGRYPEEITALPSAEKTDDFMIRTKDLVAWLTQ